MSYLEIPQSPTVLYEVLVSTHTVKGIEHQTVRYDLLFKDKLHHLDEFEEFLTDALSFIDLCKEIPDMNLRDEELYKVWEARVLKGL